MSTAYRPEIDGLRAVAVLAVVVYHAAPAWVPGGFVGVDVFFVISGYLITALLAQEWRATGRLDFAAFYARRVRRLLPALVVMVLGVMILLATVLGRDGALLRSAGTSAAWSLAFLGNVHFQDVTSGYFDAADAPQPLLHLWSLGVEEQFYLLYPLLLAALLRFGPGHVRGRLAVLAVASLLLSEYWVHIHPERAFYQMPSRFWELAAGALVALSPRDPPASRRWAPAMVAAGAVVVLGSLWLTPAWPVFPASGALPAVAGATLLLLGLHRDPSGAGVAARLLRSRPAVVVGLLSYSLYLWHWPLLVIDAAWRFDGPTPASRLLACLLAFVLAWLSWRFVERPFRRRAPPRPALAGGLAVLAACVVAVLLLSRTDRVPADAARIVAGLERDVFPASACLPAAAADGAATCRSRAEGTPGIVVWGDSHAAAWRPWVWRIAASDGVVAVARTRDGCAPRPPDATPTDRLALSAACAAFNADAFAALVASPPPVLVLGYRWPLRVAGDGAAPAAVGPVLAGFDDILAALPPGTRVIVPGPMPVLRRAATTCVQRGWEDACALPVAELAERSAATWRALDAFAARHPNVTLVDPAPFFCDAVRCPVVRDGRALYRDTNHVTASAAEAFATAWIAAPARFRRPPVAPVR